MAEIRAVGPCDYPLVADFLKDFLSPRYSADQWMRRMRHWWDANPASAAGLESGFLIVDAGSVVGFIGVVPRLLDTPGGVWVSSNTTTWWVLPDYRSLSLQLFVRTLSPKACAHVNTTPGDSVVPIMKALKFVPFPGPRHHLESIVVLDPVAVTAAALARRMPALAGFGRALNKWMGWAGRSTLKVVDRLAGFRERIPCRVLDSVGPEFDALWESRTAGGVTAVRSAAVVDWFVFGNPEFPKTLIGCFDGARLIGFLILAPRESPDLKLLECCDLYVAKDDPRVIKSLLAAAMRHGRAEGAAFVAFRHFGPSVTRVLLDHPIRLITRAGDRNRELIRTNTLTTLDSSGTYLTQMHGDRWI